MYTIAMARRGSYYSPNYRRKTQRVSSRLAKREQKKLLRQTVLISLAGLVLLVSFIVFIIPGAVRFAANIFDTDVGFESQDSIPPQVPSLSIPYTATYSASINLVGTGEPESEVVILLNGDEYERVVVDDDGSFELKVSISEGENSLVAYGIDEAENESSVSRTYRVELDSEPPKIEIESPQDGETIELRKNQLVTIKGKSESSAKVFVNGRVTYARSDGSFSTTFQLSEGENKLEIRAEDKAGNVSESELTIFFRL